MMTGIIEGMINHVLESRQESCTADYKTRQKDYTTHKGMDFVNAAGGVCAVIAVADGVVDSCRNDIQGVDHTTYTAGNFVRIKHPNGTYTRYLHLAPESVCVKVGQTVKAGDKLGVMGNTGDSYGVHLHFDVYVRGEYVDPLPYLTGEKGFGTPPADEQEDEPVTPDLRKGDEVTLSKAPLYVSSTAAKKSGTVSGTYYIHSDGIINSRIRITKPKGNTDCTGWVYAADCKTTKPPEQPALKSIDEVAAEVIRGDWGNGAERKERLTAAGYDYLAVQKKVNEIM